MDGCRTQILFFKQPQGPSDGTAVFEGSQPVSLIDVICSGDTQGLHGVTGAILGTWGDCFTVVPMALATAVRQCARGGGAGSQGKGQGWGGVESPKKIRPTQAHVHITLHTLHQAAGSQFVYLEQRKMHVLVWCSHRHRIHPSP